MLIYLLSVIFVTIGLFSIYFAFKQDTWKEKLEKADKRESVGNYDRKYKLLLGIIFIYCGVALFYFKHKN